MRASTTSAMSFITPTIKKKESKKKRENATNGTISFVYMDTYTLGRMFVQIHLSIAQFTDDRVQYPQQHQWNMKEHDLRFDLLRLDRYWRDARYFILSRETNTTSRWLVFVEKQFRSLSLLLIFTCVWTVILSVWLIPPCYFIWIHSEWSERIYFSGF